MAFGGQHLALALAVVTALVLWSTAEAATTSNDCVSFKWRPITSGDLHVAEGAIVVPIDITGVGTKLPLQLDTGSKTTILYRKSRLRLPEGVTMTTTAGLPGGQSTNVVVTLDPDTEGAPGDALAPVGTAGTSLFPNGFVIDFPRRSICSLTASRAATFHHWESYLPVNGSPVLTAEDHGRPVKLLLDTGSSGFTLLSTPRLSDSIRDGQELRILHVPSFGRTLTIRELASDTKLFAFGKPIAMARIYSFQDADIEGLLKSSGIDGLVGLRPFAHGRLGFDFAHQKLAFDEPQ